MIETASHAVSEFDHHYAAEKLRRSRNPLRRFAKSFYLLNTLREVRGPAIDFGCGAVQLLERMPPGSMGVEVNQFLIDELRRSRLIVIRACGETRDFKLLSFAEDNFRTLVISHVLAHLSDPVVAFRVLFSACLRKVVFDRFSDSR